MNESDKHPRSPGVIERRTGARRRKAEAIAGINATQSPEGGMPPSVEDIQRTLQELRVLQIELGLQNEDMNLALAELDASQGRYFDFYDLAPVGYCSLDRAGLIQEANLTTAALLGVARRDLPGQVFSRFVSGDDQNVCDRFRKQLDSGSGPLTCELRMARHDGEQFWVELRAISARDERGEALHRIVISDIAERKSSQAALEASEARYRALVEQAAEAVLVAEMDGTLVEVNAAAELLLGYQGVELIGANVRTLHPPDEQPLIDEGFAELESGGTTLVRHCHVLTRQGSRVPVEIKATVIRVGGRRLAQGIFRDMSEDQKREELRLRAEDEHREALVRDVHHRIKNSLQGVTGILRGTALRTPELAPALNEVISQVGSIAAVHGLYGSVSGGRVTLCELVADVAGHAETLWNTEVVVEIDERRAGLILVEREAVPLALILNELLANACKHGVAGGTDEKCQVAVEYAAEGAQALVRIANPGHLPADFDFAGRTGLGTGLKLVAMLLPRDGASLEWVQQGETVVASLFLSGRLFEDAGK